MMGEIKTTAPDLGSSSERREHRRKKCLLPGQIMTNEGTYDCEVLDLSAGGAKVETVAMVAPEQAVTLVVKPIGTFAGLVTWRGDGFFGMRFLAQHGTAAARAASLQASLLVAREPGPQSGPDTGMPEATSDTAAAPDAVPPAADDAAPALEAGLSLRGRSFALHEGDVICLVRKKSNGQDSELASSQPSRGHLEGLVGSGSASFVEIGAREFMELAAQKSACTISFMRVAEREKEERFRRQS